MLLSAATWWTGKPPVAGVCPGVNENEIIHSLPLPNLNSCSRQQILDYFDNTWTLTEVLFSALKIPEAFYHAPYHQLRHPLIFYYCHPAVLYINKARVAGLIAQGINPYFEQLFETGVDEMTWDDIAKNQMEWPDIAEITDYRRQVYQVIHHLIETHPDFDTLPITDKNPVWAILMGFEHERIHLETSSVLMRELPVHLLQKPKHWPDYYSPLSTEKKFPANSFINAPAGLIHLGKPRHWPSYGWDNEYGKKTIEVNSFSATQFLISNGEFMDFVVAGGYQQQRYWTDEGWKWRTFRNVKCPTFWVPAGPAGLHEYQLRLCFDIVPMQYSWPVNVNFHEAQAYAAWRSERDHCVIPYRLLTEAEHHALRNKTADDTVMSNSGRDMMAKKININLAYGSETPVNFNDANQSGFADVFGNVWEWCEDHFAPLPGFEVHALYDDFSSPCFDGKHNIIMGGSFISTGDEASIWARFHFRRHFFQHAGFRLVQSDVITSHLATSCLDAPPPYVGMGPCCSQKKSAERDNKYETQELLNQYLLMHFGNAENSITYPGLSHELFEFPKRCAELLYKKINELNISTQRVLDLGCAVGGTSFELAKYFNEVIGIDLSQSFIETANKIKNSGEIKIIRKEEGKLFSTFDTKINPMIDRHRIQFRVGDACALPADLGQFDAAILANLLCRIPSPKTCLARLIGPFGLIKPGGLLMLVSPYSWLEKFTPGPAWLCSDAKSSIEGLHEILDEHCRLIYEDNIPLVIREHARKFEYIISHATIWMKIKE